MTNEELIKSWDTEELEDYIYAVFCSGFWLGKKGNKENVPLIDYNKWLKEESELNE